MIGLTTFYTIGNDGLKNIIKWKSMELQFVGVNIEPCFKPMIFQSAIV
jgi:hypothetical protein